MEVVTPKTFELVQRWVGMNQETGRWLSPFMVSCATIALGMIVWLFLCTGGSEAKEPDWNYTTGGFVNDVAISADGEYFAAGSHDDKVYLFDKDSNTPQWSHAAGDIVTGVAISADGEYVAAGSDDSKVYLFDKDSGTPLWSYTAGNKMGPVAISVDGEYIVAGSHDDKVYLFDKDSRTPLWTHTAGAGV